jgi:hypothetical protein
LRPQVREPRQPGPDLSRHRMCLGCTMVHIVVFHKR